MTTMQIDRAVVEQALESLEWHLERGAYGADIEGVTGNLRAALSQQEEPVKPVAWEASEDGRTIQDNDFTHDVVLRVVGDFEDNEQRVRYTQRIVDKLNAAAKAEPVACPCGDRRVDQCPGEWEPGCDLGSNAKYALAQQANHLTIERLRDALVASRIIPPAAVEDPDEYDDGVTLHRIEALHRRIA